MATAEALVSLLEGFASTPQETRQVLRDWLEMDPAGFRESALAYLRDFRPVAGSGFCFHLLAARGLLDELVWEASRKSSRTLPALLTHLKSTDPDFSVRAAQSIAMRLQRDPGGCTDDLKLLMRILGATEPEPRLLPYLTRLTKASDATVASKAALLAGKLIQSGDWFVDRLLDSDPRVRANAVEALWGLDHEAAVDLFRRAARDPAGRVAANAWYGLYQAGRVESMSGLVRMAAEDDASRQASAAWAMGQTGDPRFIPTLRGLLGSPSPVLVKHALAALRAIAPKVSGPDAPRPPVRLWKDERDSQSAVWSVFLPAGAHPRPIDWRLEGASGMILELEAAFHGPANDLAVVFVLPASYASSAPDWLDRKRPADAWGRIFYDPTAVCHRVQWTGQILKADDASPVKDHQETAPGVTVQLAQDIRSWQPPAALASNLPALPAALWASLPALVHARGERHVIAVAPAEIDKEFAADLEPLWTLVRLHRIRLHFLAARRLARVLDKTCRRLAAETDGWYRVADSPAGLLGDAAAAVAGVWRVRIDAARNPGPWKLSLREAAPLHLPETAVDWEA